MVRYSNGNNRVGRALNSLKNEAANMRKFVGHKQRRFCSANPAKNEATNTRRAVRVPWQGCLPESVRGEACSCQDSREGGVHTSVVLASTVLWGTHEWKLHAVDT